MAWDVIVPDKFADISHFSNTATEAAAIHAASLKNTKHAELSKTHLFYIVAIETASTWDNLGIELINEVGRQLSAVTDDRHETSY